MIVDSYQNPLRLAWSSDGVKVAGIYRNQIFQPKICVYIILIVLCYKRNVAVSIIRETNKKTTTTTTTNNNNTKKNQRHKHKILSKKVLSRVSHRAHDGNSISSLNCNRQTLNEVFMRPCLPSTLLDPPSQVLQESP